MKLWKRTVFLMLATLLCSLLLVGGLSLYLIGKRSLNNAAETSGRQLVNGAGLLEQFWDGSQYERLSDTARRSYLEFQFRLCCGKGFALIDQETGTAVENLTGYDIVDMNALGIPENADAYDYRIQHLNGKLLLLQRTLLAKPEGYAVLSVRDITELFTEIRRTAVWFLGIYAVIFLLAGLFIYQMMRRTVRRMEELQEVAGKQELLLGALAHEMKTPLTSIIGYADTLRQVKLNQEQKDRALGHISREGRRLEKLSGKLLQMLGLHRNEAIRLEICSVKELLTRAAELEREQAQKKHVQLEVDAEDFSMEMDPELMESLIVNLTDNALHALDPENTEIADEKDKQEKQDKKVTLRAYETSRACVLQVEDNGRGIPEQELDKVTEAFYMVDKSRSRREGGAGLGLALCARIAELHKGRLTIKSKEGEGTCVTASFPRR